jgi:hypothetical protein
MYSPGSVLTTAILSQTMKECQAINEFHAPVFPAVEMYPVRWISTRPNPAIQLARTKKYFVYSLS